jgi:hypothetical protein
MFLIDWKQPVDGIYLSTDETADTPLTPPVSRTELSCDMSVSVWYTRAVDIEPTDNQTFAGRGEGMVKHTKNKN